ncbi:MAG TPA: hydroxyphenylacetyl-CoA thioesterase PaaI, partial [Acetobacteraceae bacterium]
AMWAEDAASQELGMAIEAVGPGTATLSMAVTAAMVNGHGLCHGGFIFTLADSAFAFACNSRNHRAVAAQCAITYLRPARLHDRLTAAAAERSVAGRQGITDVTVSTADGTVIAEFRGHSRTLGTRFFEDAP